MKNFINIIRIFVGSFFVFSGIVKTIDPKGTGYKLHEYFSLQDSILNIPFLADNSYYLALFFVVFEVILGILLLLGIGKKITTILLLLTMIFFTFLTFYAAYYNKVTDCGCFGDFLKLKPWVSFYKDVVLLVLSIILFLYNKYVHPVFSFNVNGIILFFTIILTLLIAHLGINHNPLFDFRPYAVGKSIHEGINSGKPVVKQTFFTLNHAKTKEQKVLSDKEYMDTNIWEDTLWVIDDTKNSEKIISEEIKPKIDGFFILTNNGDETEKYLNTEKLMLIVFPESEYCSEGEQKMYDLVKNIDQKKVNVLAVASQPNIMSKVHCGVMDDKIMKAMTRSTPGILLLKKGVVIEKYHYNDTPTAQEVYEQFKNNI